AQRCVTAPASNAPAGECVDLSPLCAGDSSPSNIQSASSVTRPTATFLNFLAAEKRAARLTNAPPSTRPFWVAAERLPMLRAVYPGAETEPALVPPEADTKRHWERAEALRELVRGRMEAAGPLTAETLTDFFQLPRTEID